MKYHEDCYIRGQSRASQIFYSILYSSRPWLLLYRATIIARYDIHLAGLREWVVVKQGAIRRMSARSWETQLKSMVNHKVWSVTGPRIVELSRIFWLLNHDAEIYPTQLLSAWLRVCRNNLPILVCVILRCRYHAFRTIPKIHSLL